MSFFSSLGRAFSAPFESLGRVTGVSINPFRPSEAKIRQPKVGLGDLTTLSSWANPGQAAVEAGLGALLGQAERRPSDNSEGLSELAAYAAELAKGEISRGLANQRQRFDLLDSAAADLAPSNTLRLAQRLRTTALSQGRETAQRRRLESVARGMATGVTAGVEEEAVSQANDLAGRALGDLLSPESLARRKVAAAELLNPNLNTFRLGTATQREEALDRQRQTQIDRQWDAARPPSLAESLIALAPELINGWLQEKRRQPALKAARSLFR